ASHLTVLNTATKLLFDPAVRLPSAGFYLNPKRKDPFQTEGVFSFHYMERFMTQIWIFGILGAVIWTLLSRKRK
ncbi:hypothetical protein, partial [Candidatus Villigracilis affinis]|uniref:hypothetical protein n=1 Tax=Candidatus Villigracilis affinis TaxID=3140682 RepID=UPI0031EAA9F0